MILGTVSSLFVYQKHGAWPLLAAKRKTRLGEHTDAQRASTGCNPAFFSR